MADLGELKAILRVDSTSLDTTMAKAKAFGSGLGPAMLGGIALAGVGFAAVTVKMATSFQTLTTQLVTGAGESVKNIGMIRQGILDMASQVGAAPDALAKGLYNIESAGFHGAAALDILRVSAEGAKVGAADQATVADAVTTALNAYHMSAGNAASVTNDLITTVALGKTHMQDLASSLGAIVPIASALNVSLPQVTGAMATMTTQGTDSHLASTSLRFLLAALAGPTSAAAKEMQGLGIGAKDIPGITSATTSALDKLGLHTSAVAAALADPQRGLPVALSMITDAIGKKFPKGSAQYEAALKGAVGGTRGLTAALELTGPNMTTYLNNINQINGAVDKGGTKVQGWALIQQDFGQKMSQVSGGLQAAAITIGDALLPKLGQFADWISHNQGPIKDIAKTIGEDLAKGLQGVGNVVQWAIDHKTVVLDIGTAIAAWWAIDKITTWEKQVMTSLKNIGNSGIFSTIGKIFGIGGSGKPGGSIPTAVQNVYVTNWEEIATGRGVSTPTSTVGSGPSPDSTTSTESGKFSGPLTIGAMLLPTIIPGDKGPQPTDALNTQTNQVSSQLSTKAQAQLNTFSDSLLGTVGAGATLDTETNALANVLKKTGPLSQSQMNVFLGDINAGVSNWKTIVGDIQNTGINSAKVRDAWKNGVTPSQQFSDGLLPLVPLVGQLPGVIQGLLDAAKAATLNANRISSALAQAANPTGSPGTGHGALSGADVVLPPVNVHVNAGHIVSTAAWGRTQ